MNLGERYKNLRLALTGKDGEPMSAKEFAKDVVGLATTRVSELENNKREMSLTELKAYHNGLGVSFEYLLGETDTMAINEDIQTACEVTGLEETAIDVLKKRKIECKGCQSFGENSYSFNFLISLLISNEHFNSAIHYLCGCLNLMNIRNTKIKNTVSDNHKITLKISDNGYSVITIDEHTDYYKYLISNCLNNSIRDIIQSYEINIYKESEENG